MEVLNPKLSQLIVRLESELEMISEERKSELISLAKVLTDEKLSQMVFVCTHNSRRSQLAEIWTNALAVSKGHNLQAFSAGTETTAFNERMLKALNSLGFDIKPISSGENPVYELAQTKHPYFSKLITDDQIPSSHFAAIMVCSDADQNCPVIPGVKHRVALPYKDPKEFDNTANEEMAYMSKVEEVGREMIFLVQQLATKHQT